MRQLMLGFCVSITCVATGVSPSVLLAQSHAGGIVVGGGGGVALTERDPDNLLRRWGPVLELHASRSLGDHLALAGAFSAVRVGRNSNSLIQPCLPQAGVCPQIVGQPTTRLTFSPLVQGGVGSQAVAVFLRAGPSLSWFPERKSGAAALVGGVQVGSGLRLRLSRSAAAVVSLDYLRAGRPAADGPRWQLVPMAGIQIR